MTKLSPHTQVVLDAAISVCHPETEVVAFQCTRLEVAAALRAAADCLPIQPLTREPPDQFEMGLSQGQALSLAELLAIADELEGSHD